MSRQGATPSPCRYVAILAIFLLAAVPGCGDADGRLTVAIVNTLPALEPIVESLETELLAAEPTITFTYLDSNAASLEEGIKSLVASRPDVIVTLNTPVSLAVGAVAGPAGLPQVFGMVTDPLGSDLVDSNEAPGRNRTGVGLLQVQKTVQLAVKATGADTIAVLHQPSDAASTSGLALAEIAGESLGVEVIPMIVETDADLDRVLRSGYPEGADVFLLIGSPFTARKLGNISLVTRTWDIPSASALTVDTLPPGFLLGVAPNSGDIGGQMAERVLAILNGAQAGSIPVGVAENVTIIDTSLAHAYGLDMPDNVLLDFDRILGS